jgi:hypothetical protein
MLKWYLHEILQLCLLPYEITMLKIWNNFIMVWQFFSTHIIFINQLLDVLVKFECVFSYQKLHQMFSNFFLGFKVFHKKVLIFCTIKKSF